MSSDYTPGGFITFSDSEDMEIRRFAANLRRKITNGRKDEVMRITVKLTVSLNEAVTRVIERGLFNNKSEFARIAILEKLMSYPFFMELIER